MKLIATKSMRFAGRSLNPGDEFDASERNGKLLKAIKKAEDAPRKAAKSKKAATDSAELEQRQEAAETADGSLPDRNISPA